MPRVDDDDDDDDDDDNSDSIQIHWSLNILK
jgi:hypothetical protein